MITATLQVPLESASTAPNFTHNLESWAGSDAIKQRVAREIITFSSSNREVLDLSDIHGIQEFPAPLLDPAYQDLFQNLRELNLSQGNIAGIPPTIGRLSNLEHLNVSYNQLTELPHEISALEKLQSINLESNNFSEFPEGLLNIHYLRDINLSSNNLESLPHAIGRLALLSRLELSQNRIVALPTSIGMLHQLRSLQLTGNAITILPESLTGLVNLRNFGLSGNHLRSLPQSLSHLPPTSLVNISHNPLPSNLELRFEDMGSTYPQIDAGPGFGILRRRLKAAETLEEALEDWQRDFRWPHLPQLRLAEGDQVAVRDFMNRLKETQDFRIAKELMGLRTFNLLKELATPEGQGDLLFVLRDGLGECGDRIALCFDHVETTINLRELESRAQGNKAQDLYNLGMQYLNLETLRHHAEAKAAKLGLGDMVEVYLGFQVMVTNRLPLPTKSLGMLYPETSCVTEEDLDALVNECQGRSKADETLFLTQWGPWQSLLTSKFEDDFGDVALRDFSTPLEAAIARDDFYKDHTILLLAELGDPTG